jgi:hypothetical protein
MAMLLRYHVHECYIASILPASHVRRASPLSEVHMKSQIAPTKAVPSHSWAAPGSGTSQLVDKSTHQFLEKLQNPLLIVVPAHVLRPGEQSCEKAAQCCAPSLSTNRSGCTPVRCSKQRDSAPASLRPTPSKCAEEA